MPILSGHRVARNIDVDESGDVLLAGRARAFTIWGYNAHATDARFLKIYDKLAAPTVGTDTPKLTLPILAGQYVQIDDCDGILFENGIGVGATTGIADADTGALGANEVIVHVTHDGR